MKPGDLVQLPDGQPAYYQYTKGNEAVVLVFKTVPSKDLKRVKESK